MPAALHSNSVHSRAPLHPHPILRIAGLCVAGVLLGLAAGAAGAAPAASDAQARYEQERSRCLTGESGQAQSTCLREAAAAFEAARRGQLQEPDANYRANAKARCQVLRGDEYRDCIDRAEGHSTSVSGSVEGGGILRESVTVIREPQPTFRREPVAPVVVEPPPAPPPVPAVPPPPPMPAPTR